ncbi:MAG: LysM peptidoglycan-binding domain-containing protein, partial [Lactobacillaceae bacterium]
AGDTLYHIARQTGISLDELLNLNHLKINSLILPGQELIIKKSVADNQNNQKVPSPSLDNKDYDQHKPSIYTVKAGDTLYHIAQELKINLSDLLEINHLNEKSLITPGQKLLISSPSKVNQQKVNKDQPSKVEVSEKETNENNTYQVVKGDTFYSISKKFGITIDELLNANNLNLNSIINPGEKLIINKSASKTSTSSEVESNKKSDSKIEDSKTGKTVAEVDQKTYTVKQGDSLYKIATSHKTTVNALEKINDLPGDLIIPGQVIRIK